MEFFLIPSVGDLIVGIVVHPLVGGLSCDVVTQQFCASYMQLQFLDPFLFEVVARMSVGFIRMRPGFESHCGTAHEGIDSVAEGDVGCNDLAGS